MYTKPFSDLIRKYYTLGVLCALEMYILSLYFKV